jgi:hypothetical protein
MISNSSEDGEMSSRDMEIKASRYKKIKGKI